MPNPSSYTDLGDGTVKDNVTGLMWQQNVATDPLEWDGARALCEALTLGGHTDWRLPSRIELVTLQAPLVCTGGGVCIDPTAFPSAPAGVWYWSSTVRAADKSLHWNVWANEARTFWFGTPVGAGLAHIARCVR